MTTASLNDQQRSTLTAVLDQIIPPRANENLAGAGGLDLADAVASAFGDSLADLGEGLGQLAAFCEDQDASAFPHLLRDFDVQNPGFMPGLVFHTYTQYYQDLRVVEVLGIDPRPPYPGGYELETGDFSTLEAVKARGPIYRQA